MPDYLSINILVMEIIKDLKVQFIRIYLYRLYSLVYNY